MPTMRIAAIADRRRGFTLLELLVVIVIISILASILLVVVNLIARQTDEEKTRAILGTIDSGVERYTIDAGGVGFRPAPHPLLQTADNRGGGFVNGGLMADPETPFFFGWPARWAGVFGVPQQNVVANMSAEHVAIYGLGQLAVDGTPEDTRQLLQHVLAHSDAESELRSMDALIETTASSLGLSAADFDARLILNGTLYTEQGTDPDEGLPEWSADPARLRLASTQSARWKEYRLPGVSIVDAWGNDVIVAYGRQSSTHAFVSAGPDGALAIDPGKDRIVDSTVHPGDDPDGQTYDGDDRDGRPDNLVSGVIQD